MHQQQPTPYKPKHKYTNDFEQTIDNIEHQQCGRMEGRFPDSLLSELRGALQNQCVFGLCRILKCPSRWFLNRSTPSIVFRKKPKRDLPKTSILKHTNDFVLISAKVEQPAVENLHHSGSLQTGCM